MNEDIRNLPSTPEPLEETPKAKEKERKKRTFIGGVGHDVTEIKGSDTKVKRPLPPPPAPAPVPNRKLKPPLSQTRPLPPPPKKYLGAGPPPPPLSPSMLRAAKIGKAQRRVLPSGPQQKPPVRPTAWQGAMPTRKAQLARDVIAAKKYEKTVDDFIKKLVNFGFLGDTHELKRQIFQGTLNLSQHPELTELPPEIGNLTGLKNIIIDNTPLSKLPPEIGKLTYLHYLQLFDTQVSTLPPEIANIRGLRRLSLTRCPLSTLPPAVGNLTNLQDLHLQHTRISSLPPEIGNLRGLMELHLDSSPILSLPPEIGNLNLSRLDLRNTRLTTLPMEIGNCESLNILNLERTPLAAQGTETTWGRQELRARFGDGVVLDSPSSPGMQKMPASTDKKEVYQELDSKPIGINREKFKTTKMPEIPGTAIEDGREFLTLFNTVLKKLNFERPEQEDYISYELLTSGAPRGKAQGSNKEMIEQEVINRLTGYLKTLYGIPPNPSEEGSWPMYADKIPALKKALGFILSEMAKTEDKVHLSGLFTQLVHGMLHCPTGQKEGIDTVCLSLLETKTMRSTDLVAIANNVLAAMKNLFFKTAVLTKGSENTQNVHLISTYEDALKTELGLSNVLQYDERMGRMGTDPFNNNPANVLKVFYDLVTPERLAGWLLDKTKQHHEKNAK